MRRRKRREEGKEGRKIWMIGRGKWGEGMEGRVKREKGRS